ncbi:hypothetical protein B9Z55_021587 [Caenorhabditis nigoni]|uniref:F-box domain-containing protein n=1 Tax=Caenorhabditis nigoni TaxID=1611254 RepID=A0A2G5TSN2_9PELO|nr:hypothetical protein B9Z55_021587 [Caenorhabditis nigoni]
MPTPILSLPIADLQYAVNCMEIDELIAFSLCSNRTKNLVKSSKRKIEPIYADVDLNLISLRISPREEEFERPPPQSMTFRIRPDFLIKLERENESEYDVWRTPEFTQSDLVAHFLSIFNEPLIHVLKIENTDISYLDTVKQIMPKFDILEIDDMCSDAVAKMAFFELAPIAVEQVIVHNNIFDNENDITEFLTLNLTYVFFFNWEKPLKLKLSDLLVANVEKLSIMNAKITEQELNRFLKLWMKGNHRFYRPTYIKVSLEKETNHQKVFRGIKCVTVNHESRLKRADGKELLISIQEHSVYFEFQE